MRFLAIKLSSFATGSSSFASACTFFLHFLHASYNYATYRNQILHTSNKVIIIISLLCNGNSHAFFTNVSCAPKRNINHKSSFTSRRSAVIINERRRSRRVMYYLGQSSVHGVIREMSNINVTFDEHCRNCGLTNVTFDDLNHRLVNAEGKRAEKYDQVAAMSVAFVRCLIVF